MMEAQSSDKTPSAYTSADSPATTQKKTSKVEAILKVLFKEVITLKEYLSAIPTPVVKENDKKRYKMLIDTTLVGLSDGSKPLPKNLSPLCLSHQPEIVLRAIERMRRRDGHGKNLLTIGFNQMSDNPRALISTSIGTEYAYPNFNTTELQNVWWKTLLGRIGDSAMQHLLENTAIFILASNTCYIQISGIPLYELWPYTSQTNVKIPQLPREENPKWHVPKSIFSRKQQAQNNIEDVPKPVTSERKQTKKDMPTTGKSRKRKRDQTSDNDNVQTQKRKRPNEENLQESDVLIEVHSKSLKEEVEVNCDLCPKKSTVSGKRGKDSIGKCGNTLKDDSSTSSEEDECYVTVIEWPTSTQRVQDQSLYCSVLSPSNDACQANADVRNENVAKKKKTRRGKKKKRVLENDVEQKAYDFHVYLDRASVLYCRDLTEKFQGPSLDDEECKDPDASTIFSQIFEKLSVGGTVSMSSEKVDALKEKLLPLLTKMLNNHKKCRYRSIVNYYCPIHRWSSKDLKSNTLSSSINTFKRGQSRTVGKKLSDLLPSKTKKLKPSVVQLLQQDVQHQVIFQFVKRLILQVVPSELIGTETTHNRNVLLKNVKKFIGLGRYEKMSLGQLMTGMKVTEVDWLSCVTDHQQRQHCLARVVLWLFYAFILGVMKGFFYVTDSTAYRNHIFYYRKCVWRQIRQKTVSSYLKSGMLTPISQENVKQQVKTGKSLGISTLRFMPKSKSLRPIINMSRPQTTKVHMGLSINRQLQNLHHVLTYHKELDHGLVGSGVFGIDDIYLALSNFVQYRKKHGDNRELFFVKVDIKKCYDTIIQKKLYDIVKPVLAKANASEYIVRRWASIIAADGSLKRCFHRNVSTLAEFRTNFKQFVSTNPACKKLTHAVIIDQVLHVHEEVSVLLNKLRAHLFHNIIKIGRQHYVQTVGISQGAVTSTQLCNYYYGHMEREKQLPHACKGEDGCNCQEVKRRTVNLEGPCGSSGDAKDGPKSQESTFTFTQPTESAPSSPLGNQHGDSEELLMRMVDDFLFVTPYKNHAHLFLTSMLQGFEDYNCFVNPEKTVTNFACEHEAVQILTSSDWLPWCGLLLNMKTLEVQADYTRYSDISVEDTLTVELSNHPGSSMKRKLLSAMRAKCHPIFFDPMINSTSVLAMNLYKLFLLSASKFHVNAKRLSQKPSVNPTFFIRLILSLPQTYLVQIRRKLRDCDLNSISLLSKKPMQSLCLNAFILRLQKCHAMYFNVLPQLRATLRNTTASLDADSKAIILTTIRVLPAEFEHIID